MPSAAGDTSMGVSGCGPSGCQPNPCYGGHCQCDDDSQCKRLQPAMPFCIDHRYCAECRPDRCSSQGEPCDSDCESGEHCDPFSSACVVTCSDKDATYPEQCTREQPYCDVERGWACVECVDNAGCAQNERHKVCHFQLDVCVECVSSRDCTDQAFPVCHLDDFTCHACEKDYECPSGTKCMMDGRCVQAAPQP
jgi:hypothetical protein